MPPWPTESEATWFAACGVIVRPSRDAALLTLRVLHELAHLLLQE